MQNEGHCHQVIWLARILKACDLKKACALKKACLAKEVPDILANLEKETLKKVWVLTVPLRKGTSACT